jgi:ATP-dependent helicase IRC3
MPAYRFSWDPFDDRTVAALVAELGFRGPTPRAREYLTSQVKRPDEEFVRKTKDVIAKVWLPQQVGVGAAIVRELFDLQIGPMGAMPTDAEGCARYVSRCKNTSRLREILLWRLESFGDMDSAAADTGEDEFVPRFGIIHPSKQSTRGLTPFPHQTEAWNALDRHFGDAKTRGVFKGMLVMPTGAGKTHTAADWLLRNWINEGCRVLWIAHRDELLRQAAHSFYRLGGLATRRDRLRIRIVSGRHCRFHQIDPADDIVLCSVHSLARALDDAEELLKDARIFVVIDEAHHAPAKSYRDAIRVLETAASHRLLGLTATPTRTAEDERPELARLFGNRTLYQVTPNELIAQGLLAQPLPAIVSTGIDAERHMTPDDFEHLRDFHDLSAEMRARLGRDEQRNLMIVNHYLENRDKYGKTLIFTTDVEGAWRLADAFRARLPRIVDAAYVASWRPDAKDDEHVDDRHTLQRYRDPNSGLDVLINVDMLTEGVDLPMTRTVFLARPTSSEILLRQMIGRALRGPAAGGHKEAHIVSFEDHWSEFRDVLSPAAVLTDIVPADEPAGVPAAPAAKILKEVDRGELPPVSWDHILAFSRAIRASVPDPEVDVFEAVPHGMYVLEYETEGVANRHIIHVYDHQRTCWNALFTFLSTRSPAELESVDVEALDVDLFGDCEPPSPSRLDIATIVERVRKGDPCPQYVPLEGRAFCDPHGLAKLAREKDMRSSEINALLLKRHTPLARVIYPSAMDFRRAFDDAMRELEFPGEAPPPKGIVQFEPLPSNPMRSGPHHDLAKLFADMLDKGSDLLGKRLQHDGPVEWSRRIIKGWFGVAHSHGALTGHIRINCLLDSPDFSAETLRFLLWHEYLHVYLKQGHTDEFRRLERMWPNYVGCNREMDALHEKFGVQYW